MKLIITIILLANILYANIGNIVSLRGDVEVIRDNNTNKNIQIGFALEKNDLIKTGKKAKLQIVFSDETIITLGKESEFKVYDYFYNKENKQTKPKASFGFLKGSFKSVTGQIGKIAKNRFKLRTKTATLGIRGTTIIGITSPLGDKIACTDGAIAVSSLRLGGLPVIVPAGKITIIKPNKLPTPPRVYSPNEITSMENETTIDKGDKEKDNKDNNNKEEEDKKDKDKSKDDESTEEQNEEKKEDKQESTDEQKDTTEEETATNTEENKQEEQTNEESAPIEQEQATTETKAEDNTPIAETTQQPVQQEVATTPEPTVTIETSIVEVVTPVVDTTEVVADAIQDSIEETIQETIDEAVEDTKTTEDTTTTPTATEPTTITPTYSAEELALIQQISAINTDVTDIAVDDIVTLKSSLDTLNSQASSYSSYTQSLATNKINELSQSIVTKIETKVASNPTIDLNDLINNVWPDVGGDDQTMVDYYKTFLVDYYNTINNRAENIETLKAILSDTYISQITDDQEANTLLKNKLEVIHTHIISGPLAGRMLHAGFMTLEELAELNRQAKALAEDSSAIIALAEQLDINDDGAIYSDLVTSTDFVSVHHFYTGEIVQLPLLIQHNFKNDIMDTTTFDVTNPDTLDTTVLTDQYTKIEELLEQFNTIEPELYSSPTYSISHIEDAKTTLQNDLYSLKAIELTLKTLGMHHEIIYAYNDDPTSNNKTFEEYKTRINNMFQNSKERKKAIADLYYQIDEEFISSYTFNFSHETPTNGTANYSYSNKSVKADLLSHNYYLEEYDMSNLVQAAYTKRFYDQNWATKEEITSLIFSLTLMYQDDPYRLSPNLYSAFENNLIVNKGDDILQISSISKDDYTNYFHLIAGTKTAEAKVQELTTNTVSATYTGKIYGVSTQSGLDEIYDNGANIATLNFIFGTSNVSGSFNFSTEHYYGWEIVFDSGVLNSLGYFTVDSFTSAHSGIINGWFFGENGLNVGGNFKVTDNSSGDIAVGVFEATRSAYNILSDYEVYISMIQDQLSNLTFDIQDLSSTNITTLGDNIALMQEIKYLIDSKENTYEPGTTDYEYYTNLKDNVDTTLYTLANIHNRIVIMSNMYALSTYSIGSDGIDTYMSIANSVTPTLEQMYSYSSEISSYTKDKNIPTSTELITSMNILNPVSLPSYDEDTAYNYAQANINALDHIVTDILREIHNNAINKTDAQIDTIATFVNSVSMIRDQLEISPTPIRKIANTPGSDYLEIGYWDWEDDPNPMEQFTWIKGIETTAESKIQELMDQGVTATYTGKAYGTVIHSTGFDPITVDTNNEVKMNINFGTPNVDGHIKFNTNGGQSWNSTFDAGTVNTNGFNVTNMTSNHSATIKGKYYGDQAQAIGGSLNIQDNSTNYRAVGVFGATK
jgi:hypothetical protein